MARRHDRSRARRRAIQLLYMSEIHGEKPTSMIGDDRCFGEEEPLSDYALQLVKGVEEHRAQIDEQVSSTSENWSIARMPIIDRSILRLATYEMTFVDEVPISVSINEAVELAREFGGEDDSPRFVNGVLGRIAKRLEEKDGCCEAFDDVTILGSEKLDDDVQVHMIESSEREGKGGQDDA